MYISLCICIYTIQEPRDVLIWSTYIYIYIYIVRSYIHSLYSHTYIYNYIYIYTIQEPRIVPIWSIYIYIYIYIVCSYKHSLYSHTYIYIYPCIHIYNSVYIFMFIYKSKSLEMLRFLSLDTFVCITMFAEHNEHNPTIPISSVL